MKVLETNRRVFTWVCICPAEPGTPTYESVLHLLFAVTTISIDCCVMAASIIFFLENIFIDLAASLFVILQICSCASVFYMAMTGISLRQQMGGVFQTLQRIYDESNINTFSINKNPLVQPSATFNPN